MYLTLPYLTLLLVEASPSTYKKCIPRSISTRLYNFIIHTSVKEAFIYLTPSVAVYLYVLLSVGEIIRMWDSGFVPKRSGVKH